MLLFKWILAFATFITTGIFCREVDKTLVGHFPLCRLILQHAGKCITLHSPIPFWDLSMLQIGCDFIPLRIQQQLFYNAIFHNKLCQIRTRKQNQYPQQEFFLLNIDTNPIRARFTETQNVLFYFKGIEDFFLQKWTSTALWWDFKIRRIFLLKISPCWKFEWNTKILMHDIGIYKERVKRSIIASVSLKVR